MKRVAKHPEMKSIAWSIEKIAKDMPCEECKNLKASLRSAKAEAAIWKKMYRGLEKRLTSDRMSGKLMKKVCGGKFPKDPNRFNFDCVPEWRLENGDWVPYDGCDPAPGPDLRVKVELVPF